MPFSLIYASCSPSGTYALEHVAQNAQQDLAEIAGELDVLFGGRRGAGGVEPEQREIGELCALQQPENHLVDHVLDRVVEVPEHSREVVQHVQKDPLRAQQRRLALIPISDRGFAQLHERHHAVLVGIPQIADDSLQNLHLLLVVRRRVRLQIDKLPVQLNDLRHRAWKLLSPAAKQTLRVVLPITAVLYPHRAHHGRSRGDSALAVDPGEHLLDQADIAELEKKRHFAHGNAHVPDVVVHFRDSVRVSLDETLSAGIPGRESTLSRRRPSIPRRRCNACRFRSAINRILIEHLDFLNLETKRLAYELQERAARSHGEEIVLFPSQRD